MTLEPKFEDEIHDIIEECFKIASKDVSNYKILWKCDSEDDFLYGWYLGQVYGHTIEIFHQWYNREPNQEEHDEIISTLEQRSNELREELKKRRD